MKQQWMAIVDSDIGYFSEMCATEDAADRQVTRLIHHVQDAGGKVKTTEVRCVRK